MKTILIFLFLSLTLFASNGNGKIKAQILEKILSGVYLKSEMVVWSDDKKLLSILEENANFTISRNFENATIIILNDKKNLQKNYSNKNIFVLKYNLLFDIPQSFGSFFWKKGRPNIVLINPRIKKSSIEISKELEPFLEEKVW